LRHHCGLSVGCILAWMWVRHPCDVAAMRRPRVGTISAQIHRSMIQSQHTSNNNFYRHLINTSHTLDCVLHGTSSWGEYPDTVLTDKSIGCVGASGQGTIWGLPLLRKIAAFVQLARCPVHKQSYCSGNCCPNQLSQ